MRPSRSFRTTRAGPRSSKKKRPFFVVGSHLGSLARSSTLEVPPCQDSRPNPSSISWAVLRHSRRLDQRLQSRLISGTATGHISLTASIGSASRQRRTARIICTWFRSGLCCGLERSRFETIYVATRRRRRITRRSSNALLEIIISTGRPTRKPSAHSSTESQILRFGRRVGALMRPGECSNV